MRLIKEEVHYYLDLGHIRLPITPRGGAAYRLLDDAIARQKGLSEEVDDIIDWMEMKTSWEMKADHDSWVTVIQKLIVLRAKMGD